jgi:hypothetical protein
LGGWAPAEILGDVGDPRWAILAKIGEEQPGEERRFPKSADLGTSSQGLRRFRRSRESAFRGFADFGDLANRRFEASPKSESLVSGEKWPRRNRGASFQVKKCLAEIGEPRFR